MLAAEVPPILVDAGTIAGVIVAILAAGAAFSKTRAVRYVWRHLISNPIGEWQTKQIESVVAPLGVKLDETATALVDHMGEEVRLREEDFVERAARQDEMDSWRDEVRSDIGNVREDIKDVHRRLDRTLAVVAAGNPEIHEGALRAATIDTEQAEGIDRG